MKIVTIAVTGAAVALIGWGGAARADDLYRPTGWSAMSADRTARQVGDALTIVVYQAAEASNSAKTDSARSTRLSGQVNAQGSIGSVAETGGLALGGGYTGGGAVQRSERFVTQITVTVAEVLPNGDLIVVGDQRLRINGEQSDIGVRGRVRTVDIDAQNRVASNRVADAQISYDGRGFVSKSAKPGLINRVFRFLGLG